MPLSPPGFVFRSGDNSHEVQALCSFASLNRIPWRSIRPGAQPPGGWVPCGSVEWVTEILGRNVPPDYVPTFLEPYLHRKVWRQNGWPSEYPVFLKPSDRYKRFPGFIAKHAIEPKETGPFWCSEVVHFSAEWRYYIARGHVLAARWYAGLEEDTPAPDLGITYPMNYCGAVDFGKIDGGRVALVEAHHPFACGWYGTLSEGRLYAEWLCAGWESLSGEGS